MSCEVLARFAFKRGHFRTQPPRAKRQLLEPTKDGQTSVACCIDNLSDVEVQALGVAVGQARADKHQKNVNFYGWMQFPSLSVEEAGLQLQQDAKHHANIVGWPAAQDDRWRLQNMLIVQAFRMHLVKPPIVIPPQTI